jgi:hypothetical protein
MLSARIAERLRERRHDVSAAQERPVLRGLADPDVFEHAQREQRAIVTYNRDDFLALDRHYRTQGRAHHGVVILNPRRFPQAAATTGALITALELLLNAGPPYPTFVHWLQ